MKIGETIRKLRKEKDITQEVLADFLNISYQAVSKWETGLAYPDLTLIPSIARIFGVTTDYLFSMSDVEEEEFLANLKKEYQHLSSIGDVDSAIKLSRDALIQYPSNFYLLTELVSKLWIKGNPNDLDEIITKSNLVINNCKDDDIRYSAIQILCFAYDKLNEKEKAIETAKKFPSFLNQERVLRIIYQGEEKIKLNQNILFYALDDIGSAMSKMSYKAKREGNFLNAIDYLDKIIKIYDILFENQDFHFHHVRLTEYYLDLASLYAEQKDQDNTIQSIKSSLSHGYRYDHLPEELPYTSISFNLLKYEFKETSINTMKSTVERIYERLSNPIFDFIRETSDYQLLIENYKE